MGNDNTISTNADKIAENERVVRGGKEEVVKDGEIVDTNDITALDLKKAKSQNYQIGQRICKIRKLAGLSSEQFYSLLYPDSKEAPKTKEKRMNLIENAAAFDRDKDNKKPTGAILLDFPRLLFISQHFNVPLNDLLYGKAEPTAETPPVLQEKKETEKPTVKTFLQCVDELLKAPAIKDIRIETNIDHSMRHKNGGSFALFVTTRPADGDETFKVGDELLEGIEGFSTALNLPPYHIAKRITIEKTISAADNIEISSDEKRNSFSISFSSYHDWLSPYERSEEYCDKNCFADYTEDHDEN